MSQNLVAIIVVVLLLVPGSWWVSHTRLVVARNEVEGSWADVDAELQRRHDLVPDLVAVVEATAGHEHHVLAELARRDEIARAAPHTPAAANLVEPPFAETLAGVVALQERSPRLIAAPDFLELQRRLSLIEDRIAAARRFYNSRVERLNRRIDAIPSGLVARRHGFAKAEFFDA